MKKIHEVNPQNNIVISITNISKKYEIHHEKPTLVEKFVKGKNEIFWALNNVSFAIKRGEKVGIVGHNGSGKTTLLKILAGITSPTQGQLITHGKIVSLIDLQAGFHADLSGYQNIFLNGMLLGLHRNEIEAKINKIIAFADLRQFIDAPLFTYSSGMALRLGFSIAVHANPDILLLDENLSAGDIDFQEKSQAKIQEFFRKEKTVISVTHQLDFIRKNCQRVLILHRGTLLHDGGIDLLSTYEKM